MADKAGDRASARTSANLLRRWRWPVVLLGLYALAGFVGVPWLIRHELPELVRETIGRETVLGKVRFNPFTLRLEAHGFELHDTDGTKLVSLDGLLVDIEASSLWHRALTLAELHLDGLYLDVVRDRAGAINLLQLLPPASPDDARQNSELPRLIVQRLRLTHGVVDFTDEVPASAFHTRLAPVELSLDDLSTLPDATGRHELAVTLESGAKLTVAGDLALNPLRADGELHLTGSVLGLAYRYLGEGLRFEAPTGHVEAGLHFELHSPPTRNIELALKDIDVKIRDLELHTTNAPPFLKWSQLHLAGGTLRWPEQAVSAQSIVLKGPDISAARDAAGRIDLLDLLLPVKPAATDAAPVTGETRPDDSSSKWTLNVAQVGIEDMHATFTDAMPVTPARIAIADLDLTLRDLTLDPGARLPLDVRLELQQGGVVQLTGTMSALPKFLLDADLTVSDFALAQLQPYVNDTVRMEIRHGDLAIDGHVTSAPEETLLFDGDVSVRNFDTCDQAKREKLLAWRELGIDDLRLHLDGGRAKVSRVRLDQPFARVFIARDRSTNFGDLLVDSEPAAAATKAPGFQAHIGKVLVRQGGIDFTDLSLPLPFAAHIQELQGEFTTIDTKSSASSHIALEGRVGEYGLAQVTGELRTSSPTDFADIGVAFHNIEMAPLSPYTVKFAGRKIAGGRINLDLRYRLDNRRMKGTNQIVIDELVLGEKVPRPDAVDLPLSLAVALLKDANGRIDIDMPVSGSLDDPEFRIGPVFWKAFVNLITKAATSPFRMLGNLMGMESADFGRIEFAPGRADLLPPEREKLLRVVEALAKRPQLAVSVPRVLDPQADSAVLRAGKLQSTIDAALAASGAPESGRARDRRTRRVIESLYSQQFPDRDLDTLQKSFVAPPADEPDGRARLDELAYLDRLRADLVEVQIIDAADLTALATAREAAVIGELTASGAVTAERVHPGEQREVRARDGAWIGAELSVQPVATD